VNLENSWWRWWLVELSVINHVFKWEEGQGKGQGRGLLEHALVRPETPQQELPTCGRDDYRDRCVVVSL
jgi:hypothetical protein